MNRLLTDKVVAPPVVDFRMKAAGISPSSPSRFDMSQAVPNMPTPIKLRRRLADALLEDSELSFYTDVPGLAALRGRIAESHPLGRSFGPDNVVITAGANHAMLTAFLLHFQAGDTVVLLEPYYFNYDMGLRMLGMRPSYCQLRAEAGFQLVARELVAFLEQEPAKGVVIVTPNNPTGATYASSQLVELLRWTSGKGIDVLLDETYGHYDPSHLEDPELGAFVGRGLTLVGSFSKTYSLTGYRVGYMATGEEQVEQVLKIQDTAIICAPHISQMAALFGMEDCADELRAQQHKTAQLGRQFREITSELRAFSLASCGAFFAYIKHPRAGMTSEQATLELYGNTGILGLPGTVFGASQTSFIRLAFCNLSPQDLEAAGGLLLDYDRTLRR